MMIMATGIVALAQSKSSTNRYRMMLRAMELGDTTAASQGEKLAGERTQASSGDALEGVLNPATYLLGPGDQLLLTIVGKDFTTIPITVLGEGDIILPNIGEINVAGRSIIQAESLLTKIVMPMYRDARVRLVLLSMRRFRVYIAGLVDRHDILMATPIDRVSTMIDRAGGFAKKGTANLIPAFRHIVLEHRDGSSTHVDLGLFYYAGDLSANPTLRDGDVINISAASSNDMVGIYGSVRLPGEYQFDDADSLSTLIRMAQGFGPAAYLDSIEVARFSPNGIATERFYVNCTDYVRAPGEGNRVKLQFDFLLHRGDQVYVREKPKWHVPHIVAIAGEVRFPGRYPINKDSSYLSEVIARAGGFSDEAAIEEAEVIRRSGMSEIDREFERLVKMIPSEMTKEEYEYFKAKARERPGVLVVDFKRLFLQHDRHEDIMLRDEDSIYVPMTRNAIAVIGRVNNPGRLGFDPTLKYDDYVQRAGGYGFRADESGVRVIKTRTGEMFDPRKSTKYDLEAGDTIFVPEETETNIWPVVVQTIGLTAQVAGVLFGVYAISRK